MDQQASTSNGGQAPSSHVEERIKHNKLVKVGELHEV